MERILSDAHRSHCPNRINLRKIVQAALLAILSSDLSLCNQFTLCLKYSLWGKGMREAWRRDFQLDSLGDFGVLSFPLLLLFPRSFE